MDASTKDGITLGIALLGAVLGVLNLWRAVDRDRIRVRVVPQAYFREDGVSGICIDVTNLGFIAITITMVGFDRTDGKQLIIPNAIIQPGKGLPIRLEPRTSFTVYMPPSSEYDKQFSSVKAAFAKTACGKRVRGSSAFLRSLAQGAANG